MDKKSQKIQILISCIAILISIIAIVFAALSHCESKDANDKAEKLGSASLISDWRELEDEFNYSDSEIATWEKESYLERDGDIPASEDELDNLIDQINPPSRIVEAYEQRWRAWRGLQLLADTSYPYNEWIDNFELTLPSHPPLPQGTLPIMTDVPLDKLNCIFGGIHAPCEALMKDGEIGIWEDLIGPNGKIMSGNIPTINFGIPIAIHKTNEGYVFDVEVYDQNGEPVILIEKSQWMLLDTKVGFAHNNKMLEVIGHDGLPTFQIGIFPESNTLLIGGRFVSSEGDVIVALPDRLVTDKWIIDEIYYVPGEVNAVRNINIWPSELIVEISKAAIQPWFSYRLVTK